MNSQGFSPTRLTWPAYDGGRKRENSSAWKHRIIVASTCRRSVEFGRYVTLVWIANCVRDDKKCCLCIISPWKASLKNVTMCVRNSRKSCLIGWLHSIKGTCQPPLTGLDIKQFGPLAQGASRFEKSLAQGPVDFASHWPTNSPHRQHAHSLRQNRSHGKSCNSVHCLL